MIDGCRCRFMSQRTVCVICVSPSACLALLRGRGRGFDSTNRECICPTASRLNEFCREPSATRYVYILNSKRHRSCRNPSSHASASITPSEVQRALLFLVCQISILTSAERVSHPWPARRRGRSRRRAVRGATNTGRHHNADYHTAALLAISVATLPSVPW